MRRDILFGEVDGGYDLLIRNGDFVISDSDMQHTRHIINAQPGHYKQYPRLGAGIHDDLNGAMDGDVMRRVQLHLKSDTYRAQKINSIEKTLHVKL
ncbi:MAG TPA: hypothetical protein PK047_06810 [Saprospiraceae bacterium]|jgi:hypothetical protein|nr:hypothetical protein [Saprospiraceae bacterium]HRP41947.1 hypothetical protein [Saprospiraceae bacterium]